MTKKIGILACLLVAGYLRMQAQGNGNEQYKDADPKELVNRKDLSFDRLESIQHYYRYGVKDEARADELEALLVKKDPKGPFARLVAFHHITDAKTAAERLAFCEGFLRDFPLQEWNRNPARQAFIYYTTFRLLGERYFEDRQFGKLLATCGSIDFKTENEIYRWNVMRAYVFKMVGYDTLYRVSTPLIRDLIAKVKDSSYIEEGVFDAGKAQENANQQLDNELGTHIQLLCSLEKYQEAKGYFNYLSSGGRYASADLNLLYMKILGTLGERDAIQPFLEKCVSVNAVTPEMFAELKKCYEAKHSGMDGYDKYVASLHNREEQTAIQSYVREHLCKWEYQPFALEDAGGQLVRSSDWGNKIVVIDFWATWCKPCIEAFPGMQMLIDKYSKDDNVGIYFIGTMQFGDYKAKSVDYVKRQGYHGFHLLHDAVSKKTGEQNVVFRSFVPFFNSSGIPRKVVLKDGLLRYTSEGYSGSPSKLVDELSTVIEYLKAEDK